MKILVGLGNPGSTYIHTRHNAGFLYLDFLVSKFGKSQWKMESKLRSSLYDMQIGDTKVLLVKPETFMNNSGDAVAKCFHFYKKNPSDLIVVHDDLDIELGKYKLVSQKGPKGHNGLLSIEQYLHTNEFTRLRLGVNNRIGEENKFQSGESYLLSSFPHNEEDRLQEVFEKTLKEVLNRLSYV